MAVCMSFFKFYSQPVVSHCVGIECVLCLIYSCTVHALTVAVVLRGAAAMQVCTMLDIHLHCALTFHVCTTWHTFIPCLCLHDTQLYFTYTYSIHALTRYTPALRYTPGLTYTTAYMRLQDIHLHCDTSRTPTAYTHLQDTNLHCILALEHACTIKFQTCALHLPALYTHTLALYTYTHQIHARCS